jgi:GAF domain-containing protein
MQRLAPDVSSREKELASASTLALQICTEYRKLMGTFLELPETKLHCCFKLMAPQSPGDTEDRVATWVRSEPFDGRPVEDGIANAHAVTRNSVWSAMLSKNDGKTTWDKFRSFSCNDLRRHSDFRCDRKDWDRYYRSTLVVPIRYPANNLGTEHNHLGFVAFDSLTEGAFRGLPDIFNYREDPTGYSERLESSAAFHLAAVLADTLGSFLGPAMDGKEV